MKTELFIGVDIGGTKTTVTLIDGDGRIRRRRQFPTRPRQQRYQQTLEAIVAITAGYCRRRTIEAVGISCGGPLDVNKGLILSPPNLPGWDRVPVVRILSRQLGLPVYLENDANAGALAEWRFGVGRGCHNLVFLTFGTGLGAGLILDDRLYSGRTGLAGEVGHIRLEVDGPVGYHKRGSFEGFCSGPGLAQQMAFELIRMAEEQGAAVVVKKYKAPGEITGRDVVEWFRQGDALAKRVVGKCGLYLGKGLSILIDLLNPDMIVIGGMGVRLGEGLLGPAKRVIREEALAPAARACRIVPAALGEKISDFAPLCVALAGRDKSPDGPQSSPRRRA